MYVVPTSANKKQLSRPPAPGCELTYKTTVSSTKWAAGVRPEHAQRRWRGRRGSLYTTASVCSPSLAPPLPLLAPPLPVPRATEYACVAVGLVGRSPRLHPGFRHRVTGWFWRLSWSVGGPARPGAGLRAASLWEAADSGVPRSPPLHFLRAWDRAHPGSRSVSVNAVLAFNFLNTLNQKDAKSGPGDAQCIIALDSQAEVLSSMLGSTCIYI